VQNYLLICEIWKINDVKPLIFKKKDKMVSNLLQLLILFVKKNSLIYHK
jgi:hypothetical protein